MKNQIYSLFVLLIMFFSGCIGENNSFDNSKKSISGENRTELKSKIVIDIKNLIKSRKEINNSTKLLSIKISQNMINLFFNEDLLGKDSASIENATSPIFSTVYYIAEEYKVSNPQVNIYVNNKLLDVIIKERENNTQ